MSFNSPFPLVFPRDNGSRIPDASSVARAMHFLRANPPVNRQLEIENLVKPDMSDMPDEHPGRRLLELLTNPDLFRQMNPKVFKMSHAEIANLYERAYQCQAEINAGITHPVVLQAPPAPPAPAAPAAPTMPVAQQMAPLHQLQPQPQFTAQVNPEARDAVSIAAMVRRSSRIQERENRLSHARMDSVSSRPERNMK